MKDVFARLGADFFSTILFIAIYLATDNVLLATVSRSPAPSRQVIYSRVKGKELGYMTWASLALVIVLGSATLLTHDPRFVLAKPAIGHFAIGVIMLKRGWMLRYMPPIVTQTIPGIRHLRGLRLGRADVSCSAPAPSRVAMTGDMKLWTFYVTVVAGRRQDRRLRHSIRRVSCFGRQPDSRCRPARLMPQIRVKRTLETVGLVWRDRLYRRSSLAGSRKPFRFAGKKCRGDKRWPWTETGTSP